MADKLIFSWRDYDGDLQKVSYDAFEAADLQAAYNSLKTELDKWTVGNPSSGGYFEELTVDDGNSASSPIAQSKSQAIIEYKDTVTGRGGYIKRIPFPNLAKANDAQVPPEPAFEVAGGVTIFNPDHTDYPLLKTQLETHLQSPYGNGIQVTRIYIEE